MKNTHTPGPWEAWLGKPSKFGVTGPAAAAAMQAIRAMEDGFGKGLWVELASSSKVCPGFALGNSPEEARANARLIAAVPDLLDALQMAKHLVASEGTDEQMKQVFDAIEKATGEKA